MYGYGQNGQNFGMPSWMEELLGRMQTGRRQEEYTNSPSLLTETGKNSTPRLFPEGHPYRRFMKNPLAGLEGDPMAGQTNTGIFPEGHPYRKFMKDPMAGLPIQEILPLSESQSPQKGNRAQQIQEIKAMTGINEEEKNRALGMMLVKLFSGFSKPGHGDGLNGVLSALAQNMGGAVDTYQGEVGRVQDLNTRLYGHVDNKEMEQQKAWQHMLEKLQEQLHKKEQFDETKRYHLTTEENAHNNAEATRLYRDQMLNNRQDKAKESEKQKEFAKIQNYLNGKEGTHIEPAVNALYEAAGMLTDKKKSPLSSFKKYDWMKSNEEKDFEGLGKDALREIAKVLNYSQADQRSLASMEPMKSGNENFTAFQKNYRLLEPRLHEYLRYQARKEALETGEDAESLFKRKRNAEVKKYNDMLEKLNKQGFK